MLPGLVASHDNDNTREKVARSMKVGFFFLLCPGKLLFPSNGFPRERTEEKRKGQLISFFLAVAHLESSDLHCKPC